MPSATTIRAGLAIRPAKPRPIAQSEELPPRNLKHAPCTSYEAPCQFFVQSPSYNIDNRPSKRPMPSPTSTIAVVNSSGRQAASFIRVASAVGYNVRAQLRNLDGIVANEISALPNVTVIVGELYDTKNPAVVNDALIKDLFRGADLAFINTTFWGDEFAIGKALADEAVRVNVKHYVYSSMPDHSAWDASWPNLPLWSAKHKIEHYIRAHPILAPRSTFLYTGIYNNNFTSLPYPLFCMELQKDGSFVWEAPFHPNVRLPWLDAEHDVGPAVLQLLKDGRKWCGQKIALAYEMLSPLEACAVFSRGVKRPVRYKHVTTIAIKTKIPAGYRDQLLALEKMYALGREDKSKQPPYFGTARFENSCPEEALALWEAYRGLEEYAKEIFPLEEAANGRRWMEEEVEEEAGSDDDSEGLTIGGTDTPARKEENWLA